MKPFPLIFAAAAVALLVWRWRRLEGESKVVLGLLAIGLGLYGTGAVHIPNIEKALEDVGTHLGKWTYLLVAVMAFAETGAFLGFVAPGEVTVLVGGLVAGQGRIDVVALLAIVWGCAVAGDLTSYHLGRRLGRGFLVKHGARVKITEERLAKVEDFFERRGGATIVVGRFLGLVRPIAPFLAGSSKMPLRRFLPYDIVAAGAWSTTFVLLGYLFWHSFDKVVELAKKGAFGLGASAAVIVAIVVAYRQLKVPENRARVVAQLERLPGYETVLAPLGRRLAGPARFVYNRLTPGELGLELTTLLAVAAVGSFAFAGYAIVLGGVDTTPGDLRVLVWSHDLQASWAVDVAKVVTWLGSIWVIAPLTLICALWLARSRRLLEAGVLVAGLALTYAAVHLAKAISDRPRPADPLVEADGSSWPSAHAAYCAVLVALAVTVARTSGWARSTAFVVVAVVAAAVVGATRLYLRAHYLSDVLAGYGLGATIFALCAICALIAYFLRHIVKSPSTS